MDGIRAQPGASLTAPTSRQDVISALLSAYGSSFTRGDGSPSSFSPVSTDKELPPPPPPRVDSLRQKPLPSIQRAEERMTMKFQLRVDEDTPPSPTGTNGRRKIMYRSLSRGAKPPSLTLTVSNGSTAIVPPTPIVTIQSQRSPVSSKYEEKLLPSPPPPPVKSDRRTSARSAVNNQQPKPHSPLVRNDSLLSQGEKKVGNSEAVPAPAPAPAPAPLTDMASVVKRKALPIPAVRKFRSLAELGAGPRGGKAGPLPISAPRKNSTGDANSAGSPKNVSRLESIEKPIGERNDPLTINRLPPTPEDEKFGTLPAPAPPRKVFTGMGLPSNPRAKGGPISPKHVRGKSSTGFNVLKAQRPAPPPPIAKMDTITPEMTPSPKLKPNDEAKMDIISPVSPLPPPTERRPFSFEAIKRPGPATTAVPNQQVAALSAPPKTSVAAPIVTPPAPSSTSQTMQLQRPTSLDLLDSSPTMPSTARMPIASPAGATSAPAPAPVGASPLSLSQQPPIPQLPPSPVEESPASPPPFTPLTRQAMPLPINLIPAVSPSQLSCYTKHSTSIWSNNTFQPMGCMVCHSNDKNRKWTCTWCRVRICKNCSDELCRIPGRNLGKLLEAKQRFKDADMVEKQMDSMNGKNITTMPGIVVSVVEDVEV